MFINTVLINITNNKLNKKPGSEILNQSPATVWSHIIKYKIYNELSNLKLMVDN
jgi:hypothetical protein